VPDDTPGSGLFYTVGRDITEEQNREEMLRQSQKMEAVGQLTGGLAYDFNNLLTGMISINARDAMIEGGRITIEAANKRLDQRGARLHDMDPGEYLSICVTDTGTGMDQPTIERAFEPFFTTKPIGQGTRLGLSMVYGFARQSGGQVRIYSDVGLGTTVCIYLPRHHGDAIDAAAASR
jgi:nitrogen fixation/metabolism regulation signal transduction histidine kinase